MKRILAIQTKPSRFSTESQAGDILSIRAKSLHPTYTTIYSAYNISKGIKEWVDPEAVKIFFNKDLKIKEVDFSRYGHE